MPWTVKDVDNHKKGLTTAQKKKWVKTANGVYKDCMKTGTDKKCAAKAIRIANSKFAEERVMRKKLKKIPNGALRLVAPDCHAFAEGEDGKKKLKLVVYSGGVIKSHWWWDDLAIDLEGVKFDRNKYPVLENHRTDMKLAFSKKPIIDGNISLDPETTVFVDTEASREFQKVSSSGFPYQASMYAIPTVVERVSEGESVDVNGFKFKGPGSIWRKCLYQEASACVFGWDEKTEAKTFSKEEVELEYDEIGKEVIDREGQQQLSLLDTNNGKEVKQMPYTLEKLTEEAPDLLKKIQDDALADSEKKFQKERDGFKTERDKLQGEIDTLTSDNTDMTDRVSKLEKTEAKREQREQNNVADAIWQAQLEASDLPAKRFEKIKQHVKAKDHLGENGLLDREKFSEAVTAEIKDWEVDEGTDTDVLGAGGGGREIDVDAQKKEKLDADNKARAGTLLKIAGQEDKQAA